jgi:hypothetical protein
MRESLWGKAFMIMILTVIEEQWVKHLTRVSLYFVPNPTQTKPNTTQHNTNNIYILYVIEAGAWLCNTLIKQLCITSACVRNLDSHGCKWLAVVNNLHLYIYRLHLFDSLHCTCLFLRYRRPIQCVSIVYYCSSSIKTFCWINNLQCSCIEGIQ